MEILDFPNLDKSEGNPLGFFYSQFNYPEGSSVTAFTVNSEDLAVLKEKFEKWVRSEFKGVYKGKKLESIIAFNWSNMSPRDSMEVPRGKVYFKLQVVDKTIQK